MFKATGNGSIPQTTISLVQLRAGQIAGSTYHTIRQTGDLRRAGETEERITAVVSWRDAPYFTGAERVALELVEAVLIPNPSGERVGDELYARASAHYDDKALWTLTLAIAQICFFIPVVVRCLGCTFRRLFLLSSGQCGSSTITAAVCLVWPISRPSAPRAPGTRHRSPAPASS